MPIPLHEEEEFEFRARAEAEAVAPPKENLPDAAAQRESEIAAANKAANAQPEKLPGVSDVAGFVAGLPEGLSQGAHGVADLAAGALEHPIDTSRKIGGGIIDAASSGIDKVMHPIDTAKAAGQYVRDLTGRKVGNLVGSGLVGGAAGKAAGVLGDVAGPSVKALVGGKPVSPTIRELANKGVVTTPGQRGGRMASAIEQRLTSEPILGDSIAAARGKATEQWNRAEINDAIKDAGGKPLPENRKGRDAIFHAKKEMNAAYARVLPKMQGSLTSADANGITFRQQMSDTVGNNRKLDPTHSKLVHNIIDNDIVAKFKSSGGYTKGDTIKEIQETLRTEADGLRRGTYQERQAAQVIDQIRTHFSDMLKRENPKLAPELDSVDKGYAKYTQIARASRYSKKGEGQYTPAQKLRAIEAKDKSKDKGRFATGQAHGQKEAEAVEKVLGNTEPDSGTPSRLMVADALRHPLRYGVSAATSPIYSQPVLKLLQNRALKRGGPYTPIGGKKAATVGAILGASDDE